MTPRLVGFLSAIDREFFEIFCSVDGVGFARRFGPWSVPSVSWRGRSRTRTSKCFPPYPGIGEATAERIVAKLRRKVGKFTLIVGQSATAEGTPAESNGALENVEPDVIRDTFAALLSVGHSESEARREIDRVLTGKKKFKSVADMIDAIYQQQRQPD